MNDKHSVSVSTARIVLFGSEGGFSRPVLEQLLAHGLCVAAVVIPDSSHENCNFPIKIEQPMQSNRLAGIAQKHNITVLRTQSLDDHVFLSKLKEQQAEILLIACFPLKIPLVIWQLMDIPCWNLHPSLLPRYRGPAPLYWQLTNGELDSGLTLHQVSSCLDAGDIVARKSISLPVNHDSTTLDEWVAEHGVNLFYETLDIYLRGSLVPEPQDETAASYFPYPDK